MPIVSVHVLGFHMKKFHFAELLQWLYVHRSFFRSSMRRSLEGTKNWVMMTSDKPMFLEIHKSMKILSIKLISPSTFSEDV